RPGVTMGKWSHPARSRVGRSEGHKVTKSKGPKVASRRSEVGEVRDSVRRRPRRTIFGPSDLVTFQPSDPLVTDRAGWCIMHRRRPPGHQAESREGSGANAAR